MAIEWHDRYALGHSVLDAQHQELLNRVNAFFAANGKTSLVDAIKNLSAYTREHFTYEENVMRRIGYPDMNAHIGQHNNLISKLSAVFKLIDNCTLDISDLESFLSTWIFNHIETSDAQLAAYIRLQ